MNHLAKNALQNTDRLKKTFFSKGHLIQAAVPSATTSNTLVFGFISKETGKGGITAHTQTDTDTIP